MPIPALLAGIIAAVASSAAGTAASYAATTAVRKVTTTEQYVPNKTQWQRSRRKRRYQSKYYSGAFRRNF